MAIRQERHLDQEIWQYFVQHAHSLESISQRIGAMGRNSAASSTFRHLQFTHLFKFVQVGIYPHVCHGWQLLCRAYENAESAGWCCFDKWHRIHGGTNPVLRAFESSERKYWGTDSSEQLIFHPAGLIILFRGPLVITIKWWIRQTWTIKIWKPPASVLWPVPGMGVLFHQWSLTFKREKGRACIDLINFLLLCWVVVIQANEYGLLAFTSIPDPEWYPESTCAIWHYVSIWSTPSGQIQWVPISLHSKWSDT